MPVQVMPRHNKISYHCPGCQKFHNPQTEPPHIVRFLVGFKPTPQGIAPMINHAGILCPDCFKYNERKSRLADMAQVFPEIVEAERQQMMKQGQQPGGQMAAMADVPRDHMGPGGAPRKGGK